MNSALGIEAASRLRRATVVVIGAGGTGSAVIEILARAGIGKLILLDPAHIEESNLERVHGSQPSHAERVVPKVEVARNHVLANDPSCQVEAIIGRLPQNEVVDAVVCADVTVGCTDRQHSRLALSDIAVRYLVPTINCAVALEGADGAVTAQVIQLVRFLVLCAEDCATSFALWIHPDFALAVENHQGAFFSRKRRPFRKARLIEVALSRKGNLGVGYLATEFSCFGTEACYKP